MLRSLLVTNVALIPRLELRLGRGLNVLTGETGAGKSILLDAFALVLGERADPGLIRAGEETARVEGLFDDGGSPAVKAFLEAAGLPVDEDLLLVRELSRGDKSRCFVNGSMTTQRVLKALGDLLVDLHGQHDHQALLRPSSHLGLVDDFGAAGHRERLAEVREAIARWRALTRELADRRAAGAAAGAEREFLDHQIAEIEEAGLEPGEDERLHDELKLLTGAEGIKAALEAAIEVLDGSADVPGALAGLRRAAAGLEAGPARPRVVDELAGRLRAVGTELTDLRAELDRAAAAVGLDPERVAAVEARLDRIHRLTRKHGRSVADVLARLEALRARRDELGGGEGRRGELEAAVAALAATLGKRLPELSKERAKLARKLAEQVQAQVRDLAMPEARVEVRLVRDPDPAGLAIEGGTFAVHETGLERAEILISANRGEAPGPLAKIASGGELSRVMLGVKAAMARLDMVPIMVFDEIDAGVGGETGKAMAEKLKAVSRSCQCLCVTHLPTVAAVADHQWRVEKATKAGRTVVTVAPVEGRAREAELARMLGAAESVEGAKLARELLAHGAKKGAKGRPSPGRGES